MICSICEKDKSPEAFSYTKLYYTRKKDNKTVTYFSIRKQCTKCRNANRPSRKNIKKDTLTAY